MLNLLSPSKINGMPLCLNLTLPLTSGKDIPHA